MAKIRLAAGNGRGQRARSYDFTVVLTPVFEALARGKQARKSVRPLRGPAGFQVTVPLLPGVITYGRNEDEALEMARDAIVCHIEGLRKSGEPIPDERLSRTEKLRIAI